MKEGNNGASTLFKKSNFKNNAQMDMLRHHPAHQRLSQQQIRDRTQPHIIIVRRNKLHREK